MLFNGGQVSCRVKFVLLGFTILKVRFSRVVHTVHNILWSLIDASDKQMNQDVKPTPRQEPMTSQTSSRSEQLVCILCFERLTRPCEAIRSEFLSAQDRKWAGTQASSS